MNIINSLSGVVRSFLVLSLILISTTLSVNAEDKSDPFSALFGQQTQFLPVEEAFVFNFSQNDDEVTLSWEIADGYYLYADKFQFAADNLTIEATEKPDATQIEDEFFGVVDVYFFESEIKVTVANVSENAELKVRYQGCAKAGLCYQPISKTVPVDKFSSATSTSDGSSTAATFSALTEQNKTTYLNNDTSGDSTQNILADRLNSENFAWVLLIFFGLGVGLAFTPCVFPMFPILSGIIAGQENLTARKGLYLAFIYVQGMALTYSLLGLIVASAGAQFQAALQHPAILISVSLIFIGLAGAMFGWYNLQLPSSWTSKLTQVSNNQKSGNVVGVFMMGLLSGLIASPCTTAPLTGALLYVAQTGDLVIGFVTLYVLSLGMGLPLLVIGLSGGKLLPKAGNWMNFVKNLFGFILLAIPVILLDRFVEFHWVLITAGVWVLAMAAYFHHEYLNSVKASVKSVFWLVSYVFLFFGLALVAWPHLKLLPNNGGAIAEHSEVTFVKVVSIADIEKEILIAKSNGQGVMLDLYADWCAACKEFEAFTFSDKQVQNEMKKLRMLQVDMTENSELDIEIMEKFQILGLPTILFFDNAGNELERRRVTGFMNAEQFNAHLRATFN
ncbi:MULTISPECIES: protein-disulfide reductase DsbD [unclassified Psychrosphaera]|uniref:protein-disulfide reductase DsbD n=1 Tax=unclassified Psychrosphaera TaxID=2641570 RepID=UPI0020902D95|nr:MULTISPECIES: protein-disulfide reductase DsbD [unclassified Psychrosphaera]